MLVALFAHVAGTALVIGRKCDSSIRSIVVTDIDRRLLIGGVTLGAGVAAASGVLAAPQILDFDGLKKEVDIACVYHCDFGDPKRIMQMATNIDNHLSVYDADPFKIRIVVVAHGQGIKPFLDQLDGTPWKADAMPPEVFQRFSDLSKLGVEVYLCQITFRNNKIDLSKARSDRFIKFVPSGVATVAALQSKGYAYMKVG